MASNGAANQEGELAQTSPAIAHAQEIPAKSSGVPNLDDSIRDKMHIRRNSCEYSPAKSIEFEFERPPECPVFEPSNEDFKNPLQYINKIRPIAEKYGIVKIRPPASWSPPFAVDTNKLKFTPRVQRLNELEAKTRIKLNFLDKLAKFWEFQGSSLRIPLVEKKPLDLYTLYRIVHTEGGLERVTKERKWAKVAQRMQYPTGKNIGTILKGHYDRILHPFEMYTYGNKDDSNLESPNESNDTKPQEVSPKQATSINETTARRSKRFLDTKAQGKTSACESESNAINTKNNNKAKTLTKSSKDKQTRKGCKSIDPSRIRLNGINRHVMLRYNCNLCNRADYEASLIICNGCEDAYHIFCLLPPMLEIPKSDWLCPRCVLEQVNKPTEIFGFEEAQREYTLQQFGEMADMFKTEYFRLVGHQISTETVEREFWRIVSSIDEDVTVEYGADLHTKDHGSGFPTKNQKQLLSADKEYTDSKWNLNNLPLLEESVLRYINTDISGIIVPWVYVGMCFATFCWHNEDHWSYSINYLHWGEPKTWYGVPGEKADLFEDTMKSVAPELFASQPDLLHQLVTIMNPNSLMRNNVPVYRTDQYPGEFVVTFPRAYHAGFNQGYNFAEAVNFAPADWLPMGRDCVNHYSTLRRFCVFSHDELVCKMALQSRRLNFAISTACYLDMIKLVESETMARKVLLAWGITKAEREIFELLPDDERLCEECKTTCFLSAVSCSCTKNIVCLKHYEKLCDCKPEYHCLQFRYTLDELRPMINGIQVKAEQIEKWLKKTRDIFETPKDVEKIALEEVYNLIEEAEERKYPSSLLLDRLKTGVTEAEKCSTVIQYLDINKMRTRTRHSNDTIKYKLTISELELFVEEIDNLICSIKEGPIVRELLIYGKTFITSAEELLSKKMTRVDIKSIEALIDEGLSLCIDLPELASLRGRLNQINWLNRVCRFRNTNQKLPLADLNRHIKEGTALVPDPIIENELAILYGIKTNVENWENIARQFLAGTIVRDLSEVDCVVEAADKILAEVPSKHALKDALRKSKDWLNAVYILEAKEHYPYIHTVENIINRGMLLPIRPLKLYEIKKYFDLARDWKEKTAKIFLRKRSQLNLLDVLSPRPNALMMNNTVVQRPPPEKQFTENLTPAQMVDTFKKAEDKELREMRELRKINSTKNKAEDVFCICNGKFVEGSMIICQLCLNGFHIECVTNNSVTHTPQSGSAQLSGIMRHDSKYLCSSCMRSRRPRLELILPLLISLQRLPIRVPEGEALQCLTERAMNWQERARQALSTDSVVALLASFTENDSTANKIESDFKNTIIYTATTEECNTAAENKICTNPQGLGSSKNLVTSYEDRPSYMETEQQNNKIKAVPHVNLNPLNKDTEHAYSVLTALNLTEVDSNITSAKVHAIPELKKSTREFLETLMMEGDLLELTLEEGQQLWKLLYLTKRPNTDSVRAQQSRRKNNERTELTKPIKKRRIDFSHTIQIKTAETEISKIPAKSLEKNLKDEPQLTDKPVATKRVGDKSASVKKKPRKRKRNSKVSKSANSSDSDEDEKCSAIRCKRPSSREVHWIQCDGGCEAWYHMLCVGVVKSQIKADEDYICQQCKKGKKMNRPGESAVLSNANKQTTSSSSKVIPSKQIATGSTKKTPVTVKHM